MVARYSGGHGIRGDTVFGGTRYSGGHGNRGIFFFELQYLKTNTNHKQTKWGYQRRVGIKEGELYVKLSEFNSPHRLTDWEYQRRLGRSRTL